MTGTVTEVEYPATLPGDGQRVYLSGPMTGIDDYNRPAFAQATETLEALGYEVVNPGAAETAEEVEEQIDELGYGGFWRECLKRDVIGLFDGDFDMIVSLPGWEGSKGATMEAAVGVGLDIPRVDYETLIAKA